MAKKTNEEPETTQYLVTYNVITTEKKSMLIDVEGGAEDAGKFGMCRDTFWNKFGIKEKTNDNFIKITGTIQQFPDGISPRKKSREEIEMEQVA